MTSSTATKSDELLGGRYRIGSTLHVGESDTVVRGVDVDEGRRVAIRLLNGATGVSAEKRRRWESETAATRAVQSAHLAELIDFGETERCVPFVVSELVEGCPLDLMLASGTVRDADAIVWVQQTSSALSAAHERGVAHRDLTPSNVSLVREQSGGCVARLFCLGTNKLLSPNEWASDAAFPYRPPEATRQPDARHLVASNVWSLGVILYELLTGCLPFRGNDRSALEHSIAREAPIPLQARRSDLPPTVGRVVSSCLEKRPEARPSSVRALVAELSSCFPASPRDWNRDAETVEQPISLRNRKRRIVIL